MQRAEPDEATETPTESLLHEFARLCGKDLRASEHGQETVLKLSEAIDKKGGSHGKIA